MLSVAPLYHRIVLLSSVSFVAVMILEGRLIRVKLRAANQANGNYHNLYNVVDMAQMNGLL